MNNNILALCSTPPLFKSPMTYFNMLSSQVAKTEGEGEGEGARTKGVGMHSQFICILNIEINISIFRPPIFADLGFDAHSVGSHLCSDRDVDVLVHVKRPQMPPGLPEMEQDRAAASRRQDRNAFAGLKDGGREGHYLS